MPACPVCGESDAIVLFYTVECKCYGCTWFKQRNDTPWFGDCCGGNYLGHWYDVAQRPGKQELDLWFLPDSDCICVRWAVPPSQGGTPLQAHELLRLIPQRLEQYELEAVIMRRWYRKALQYALDKGWWVNCDNLDITVT